MNFNELINYNIDETTGEILTENEEIKLKIGKLIKFQNYLLNNHFEKLKELSLCIF
jgi:hypothetical protein